MAARLAPPARIRGARVVGIAGGAARCAYVKGELGFDAVIDHRAPDFAGQLRAACPDRMTDRICRQGWRYTFRIAIARPIVFMAALILTESAATLNDRLLQRYIEAVDAETLRLLYQDTCLSGLFVATASESYLRSKARIMIVGRETAGWKGADVVPGTGAQIDVAAYLERQMAYHRKKVGTVDATSTFFQFYRRVAQMVAAPDDRHLKDAPVWANLFCVDRSRSRPDRPPGPASARILDLSARLLRIQIAVLKPELIVFTTGSSCDSHLKTRYFDSLLNSEVHNPKRLWEFHIALTDDAGDPFTVRAFRTPHPRHRASDDARAAAVAEALAPGAIARYKESLGRPSTHVRVAPAIV